MWGHVVRGLLPKSIERNMNYLNPDAIDCFVGQFDTTAIEHKRFTDNHAQMYFHSCVNINSPYDSDSLVYDCFALLPTIPSSF